jgi:hypothetical protein
MSVRLWEWVIVRGGARQGTSGISASPHAAMEALSRTLVDGGGTATGNVVPLALVRGMSEPFYLRGFPEHVADYDKGVIKWR